ncbi:hypothetical protein [Pleionea sediminis]|uniref:hypothetical protein n=1 Tax=Pleionea sediminis TaxID=2569479 RepID=UPI001186E5BC|nr:hypothetical protein [Pleionea sediminis]
MDKLLKLSFALLLLSSTVNADVLYSSGSSNYIFTGCNDCEYDDQFIQHAISKAESNYNYLIDAPQVQETYVVANLSSDQMFGNYKTVLITKTANVANSTYNVSGQVTNTPYAITSLYVQYLNDKREFVNHQYYRFYGSQAPIGTVDNVLSGFSTSQNWAANPDFTQDIQIQLNQFVRNSSFNPFKFANSPMAVEVRTGDGYTALLIKQSHEFFAEWKVVYADLPVNTYSHLWHNDHPVYDASGNVLTYDFNPAYMTCFNSTQREVCREVINGEPTGNIFYRSTIIVGSNPATKPPPPAGCPVNNPSCRLQNQERNPLLPPIMPPPIQLPGF